MNDAPLRLGTRRSPMAIFQSTGFAELLTAKTGRAVEIVGITASGDVNKAQISQIGGTGVFVSTLRDALLAGQVDFAVHSLKDLPTLPAQGIKLAAVPPRDDPRDALIARGGAKLADLPLRARIGTGSPRRAAQLLMLRQDLRPVPIRGNAGTRIAKIDSGEVDAVVLAYAGMARIGRLDQVSQVFEAEEMLPAPGQGALAAECLASRPDLVDLLTCVNDDATRAATVAERTVLARLEAGCSAPVGAYAAGTNELRLDAIVVAADGGAALRASRCGPAAEAERLGSEAAAELLARGADRFVARIDQDVSGGHLSNGDDAK
ncbi:MAG TPA: hydroxymethylbilane synthase [Streptosporangiaceae bacterium]|nr:hydroxymethylbilane synthase [Streptosporangiaceae bacterium]